MLTRVKKTVEKKQERKRNANLGRPHHSTKFSSLATYMLKPTITSEMNCESYRRLQIVRGGQLQIQVLARQQQLFQPLRL